MTNLLREGMDHPPLHTASNHDDLDECSSERGCLTIDVNMVLLMRGYVSLSLSERASCMV